MFHTNVSYKCFIQMFHSAGVNYCVDNATNDIAIGTSIENINKEIEKDVKRLHLSIRNVKFYEKFQPVNIDVPFKVGQYSCIISLYSGFYSCTDNPYILWVRRIHNRHEYNGFLFKKSKVICVEHECPDIICKLQKKITPSLMINLVLNQNIDELQKYNLEKSTIYFIIGLSIMNGCVDVLKWTRNEKKYKDVFLRYISKNKILLEKHYSLIVWLDNLHQEEGINTNCYFSNCVNYVYDINNVTDNNLSLYLPKDVINEIKKYC